MYRAIKSFNGGEEVEYRHFNTLRDAYIWLQPSQWRQERELWHLKLMLAVIDDLGRNSLGYTAVGWNEDSKQQYLYIQKVQRWNDGLPADL